MESPQNCRTKNGPYAKQAVRWFLATAWLIFTVYLSRQPATDSAAVSGGLAYSIYLFLGRLNINVSYKLLHVILRKIAHFGIHFVLGWLGWRALSSSCNQKRNAVIIAVILYGSIAILDELIQSIIPGRSMQAADFAINLSSILLGICAGVLAKNAR